jgi:hypothetical protein
LWLAGSGGRGGSCGFDGVVGFGVYLNEGVANVDDAVFGFGLQLRCHAVFVLNARNFIEVFEDQPPLLPLPLFEHVLLQSYETEPHAFSHHFGGGLEEGGCLLEIPFALLEAELDVGAHAVGPQFL